MQGAYRAVCAAFLTEETLPHHSTQEPPKVHRRQLLQRVWRCGAWVQYSPQIEWWKGVAEGLVVCT